ncbi:MAG: DUF494 family protein [Bacteroidota bacterium]
MTTKIVEVLAKILDGLYKNIPLEEINKMLSKDKSFDKQTLSTAFSWVQDRKLNPRFPTEPVSGSFRILTDEEREILGMENYNYFTHLINIGLLKQNELNAIIDQLFIVPGASISKEEINWIILFSLLGNEDNTLPGSRILLYSSDTIN